ncbi:MULTISPECIES: GntR family transcriptional regulator [Mammaliicoccus]|jgi:DNA-binding GntR family transcriptional regulator|uniref:GntR family transcriptional regulator n=1 Tax=Mammaliicoccus sciuri TaxID=1296 RepID=A0AAW5LGV1_MAMSC|nr:MULTISPECIES: GntR family transcriptional regulator [Mammaliicoccus]KTT79434.1 GntR family transcriptional regulator [Mammaliicoccus sciuri]MBA1397742.1 FCD domain-containing protein [Mammaliicoccus sciuri]MBF0720125.1 GntR family transcriptional regulator [Mammaliicoccus sciuri]MBG9204183.1 GntR family transcriptional regulator [Mammaliicoccus sciuri]MBG9211024.1 GntR family transcriptional regulator [Mammaliicoccus sciuri]
MANKELSIYQKIRNDIINGDLTQNEKITESKLAQRYHVSRTPIREAIKQLELEYFIRDGYIYVPTVEEYRNIFEMRILIETHAIKKASIVFTQDDIEELKRYATIGDDKTEEEIIQINDQFHQKIMSATKNSFIIDTYSKLKSYIYLFSKTVINKKRPGLIEEHQKIAEMLEKRQTEAAIELMKEHLLNDLEFSLYYLKS